MIKDARQAKPTLAQALADKIAAFALRLQSAHEAVCKKASIQKTHYMSTSMRRVLAADWVVKQLYGCKLFPKKKSGFKQTRKALGRLRDAQVMQETFATLALPNEFAVRFDASLTDLQRVCTEEFKTKLSDFDFKCIKPLTKIKLVLPMLDSKPKVQVDALRQKRLRRVMAHKRAALDNKDDTALHLMRVDYKYYRYCVELLAPVISHADSAHLSHLKTLQDAMGTAHDWVVLDESIRDFAAAHAFAGHDICMQAVATRRKETHATARAYLLKELPPLVQLEKVKWPR